MAISGNTGGVRINSIKKAPVGRKGGLWGLVDDGICRPWPQCLSRLLSILTVLMIPYTVPKYDVATVARGFSLFFFFPFARSMRSMILLL